MMTSADKVGGWVKKGQNHDDVILEWSHRRKCIGIGIGIGTILCFCCSRLMSLCQSDDVPSFSN